MSDLIRRGVIGPPTWGIPREEWVPGSLTRRCSQCGEETLFSPVSRPYLDAGIPPWCIYCVQKDDPGAIGISTDPADGGKIEPVPVPPPMAQEGRA